MNINSLFRDKLLKVWNDVKFRIAVISTMIICLIAHAYSYFNITLAHDRMTYFMEPVYDSAARAKWFAQILDMLTAFAYVPWLFGLLTMVFLAISVYLIVKILEIRNAFSIVIVAGLCVTNFSVLGAHFYWPHELVAALPMACLSAWFWTKKEWSIVIRVFGELFFVGLSLATYGAYTSVAPTLVLLVCVTELIKGEEWKNVLRRGSEYIVTFFAGMAFYYIVQRALLYFQGIQLFNYMGENKLVEGVSLFEIIEYILLAYWKTIKYYLGVYNGFIEAMPPVLARVILIFGLVLFLYIIIKNHKKIKNIGAWILLLLLLAAAPLSIGLIYVMSFGNVHYLMIFTFVLIYIYMVKLAEEAVELFDTDRISKAVKYVPTVLLMLLLFWNCRSTLICNMAYTRLESVYNVSQSVATRVLDRIESCQGFEGTEYVVFVGDLSQSEYFLGGQNAGRDYLNYFDNMGPVDKKNIDGFTQMNTMYEFLENVMGFDLFMGSYSKKMYSKEENAAIFQMPTFPADGSVKKIRDTIVVKLCDVE